MSPRIAARLVRASGAALLAGVLIASPAMAAGPKITVTRLDDPSFDRDESAAVSTRCGFPVTADVSGRWMERVFPSGGRLVSLNTYVTKATYTATRTGTVVRLRDISTERTFVRDGARYKAVTGRSVVLYGRIGRIVVALADNRVTVSRGRNVGTFYSGVCAKLRAAGAR